MNVKINNHFVSRPGTRYEGQTITIGIDSSKRNSGIAIGNENCKLRDVIELNAPESMSQAETLLLCKETRDFLKEFLFGADVRVVGIENIITVDKQSKYGGISHHDSRFKITAMFMSFISFFQDTFGITPELINNQTWKESVLPREFRARDVGKGSLAYFKSIGSVYGQYTDDATDSICILEFLRILHGFEDVTQITGVELKQRDCQVGLFDKLAMSKIDKQKIQNFQYNSNIRLEDNVVFMANRVSKGKLGVAEVSVQNLSWEQIYQLSRGAFPHSTSSVLLVVK